MAEDPDQPRSLPPYPITIISGGQTGVDRAALDVALKLNIPCGGWCPRGRIAEDGVIDGKYPLRETDSEEYAQRTEYNVRDADATLVIASEPLTEGTALTKRLALKMNKPCLVVAPGKPDAASTILEWLTEQNIRILNVAGPRRSNAPEIEGQVAVLLEDVFSQGFDRNE